MSFTPHEARLATRAERRAGDDKAVSEGVITRSRGHTRILSRAAAPRSREASSSATHSPCGSSSALASPISARCTRSSTRRRRLLDIPALAANDVLSNAGVDILSQVLAVLTDPLEPRGAVSLLSACHSIHAMPELRHRLRGLKEQHTAARSLCAKVGLEVSKLKATRELFWSGRLIDDDDCGTLAMLCSHGALEGLFRLTLDDNKVGDAGITTLSRSLSGDSCKHGMERLAVLGLSKNNISDAGMMALACACSAGALAKLAVLGLSQNLLGDAAIEALASAISAAKKA